MGLVRRFCRCFLDICVLLIVLTFLPGIPPKGTYSVLPLVHQLPLEGALAPNTILDDAVRLFEHSFSAPESIATRGNDREIFVSMHGGSIVKVFGPDFTGVRTVAKIGPGCKGQWEERLCGRPLGLRFARDGKLLVADAYYGIFKVDVETGEKERLFDPSLPINGAPPLLIDDLDEDAAGNIYWSDASTVGDLSEGFLELMAGPSGRLVKLDPVTGSNMVLIDRVGFANGVQLSPEQDFVLVCETSMNRVLRYWLQGPKAGTHDVFVQGLPGFPDNIRAKPGGGYFLSLVTVDDPTKASPSNTLRGLPSLRRLIARLLYGTKKLFDAFTYVYDNEYTAKIAYKLLSTGSLGEVINGNRSMVVVLDASGKIVSSLQGNSGRVRFISETIQVGDKLLFASPYNDYLGMIPLEKVTAVHPNIKPEIRSDQPIMQDIKPEQSKKQESKSDSPKIQESTREQPKKQETIPEQPKNQETIPEQPKKQETIPEQPKKQETGFEQPEKKEGTPELPKKQESKPEQPKKQESTPEQPKKQKTKPEKLKKQGNKAEQPKNVKKKEEL